MTGPEPSWCDPEQCTAGQRIPDRPRAWFAHRSKARIIGGPAGQVSFQIVQGRDEHTPHMFVGVTSGGPNARAQSLSAHLPLDRAPQVADAIEDLIKAARAV